MLCIWYWFVLLVFSFIWWLIVSGEISVWYFLSSVVSGNVFRLRFMYFVLIVERFSILLIRVSRCWLFCRIWFMYFIWWVVNGVFRFCFSICVKFNMVLRGVCSLWFIWVMNFDFVWFV